MYQYAIFDDMTQCTQDDILRLKAIASPQRLTQAMRFEHIFGQWACLKSYEMLLQLFHADLSDKLQHLHTDLSLEFRYNDHDKPYLTQDTINRLQTPYPFFSISHCKNAIAVAVGSQEIGIDIESRHRHISDGLTEHVMNPQEQQYIARHSDLATAFIELRTKKEALLKQRGTGITDDLRSVLTGNEPIQTHVFDSYIFSICTNN